MGRIEIIKDTFLAKVHKLNYNKNKGEIIFKNPQFDKVNPDAKLFFNQMKEMLSISLPLWLFGVFINIFVKSSGLHDLIHSINYFSFGISFIFGLLILGYCVVTKERYGEEFLSYPAKWDELSRLNVGEEIEITMEIRK